MTNNERIAQFLGWKPRGHTYPEWERPDGRRTAKGDFFKEDEHAIQILPILTEKGINWKLESNPRGVYFWCRGDNVQDIMCESIMPTISQAISNAVIQLFEEDAE